MFLLLVFPYLKRNSPPFFQLLQKEEHELPRRVWRSLYPAYENDYNRVSTKKRSIMRTSTKSAKTGFSWNGCEIPKGHSLRKQPTFRDTTTRFPAKWRLRNDLPDRCSASDWLKICLDQSKALYPDLGCDSSSVWNFCTRFSDLISQETRGCVEKCRLFSGAKQNTTEQSLGFHFSAFIAIRGVIRRTGISKIQLVVYYQCCVLIGWATTRLYVIAY